MCYILAQQRGHCDLYSEIDSHIFYTLETSFICFTFYVFMSHIAAKMKLDHCDLYYEIGSHISCLFTFMLTILYNYM